MHPSPTDLPAPEGPSSGWPVHGGDAGARIRRLEAGQTPLGAPASWPQALRTSLDLLLAAEAQIALLWGDDLVTFYNDAYAPTIGAKHPAALGRPAREVWHELWDDLGPLLDGVRTTGRTHSAKDRPFRVDRHGTLEQVFFDISYSPVRDSAGGVAGVLCVVAETTARVRAQQSAATNEARVLAEQAFTRLLLDSTNEGLYAVGPDGSTTLCNARFLQLLGYASATEVVGRKLHGEIHHTHPDGSAYPVEHCPIYLAASQGRSAHVANELFWRKDGTALPVDYRAEPIWRNGKLVGAVCTFVDVTERQLQEAALQQAEADRRDAAERIELALDAGAVLGTWVWEVPADRMTGDERFARTFGLEPRALRAGVRMAEAVQAIHPDDAAMVHQRIAAALGSGGVYSAEYRVPDAARGWRWVEANGRVELDAEGRAVRFPGVLIDIGARRRSEQAQGRAENALASTQHQLRLALAAGGIGLFSIDVAREVVTVSPEFCRLFGLPEQDTCSTRDIEALVLDDTASSSTRRINGQAPHEVQYRIRRADNGEQRWIARRAEFVRDAAGRPVAMRGAVQDITVQKSAEAALRESEARFRALAQALPSQVWTADTEGRLDWFNDRVTAYTGRDPGASWGSGWTSNVHPDDVDRVVAGWQQALARGVPYSTEFRTRRHDGTYRWHLVSALPAPQADGSVRWVGANTDIEDQKAAQAALSARNSLLVAERDRMWETSPDLLAVVDLDGGLLRVNPAWTAVLGRAEVDLVGTRLAQILHPDDCERTATALAEAGAGPPPVLENRCRHQDGSYRWIAWRAAPTDGVLFALGRDVTAHKLAEDALRETEARLRQSHKMEALGQLTGGIAHDFNNLLQGITGSIEVVRRRIAAGRTDDLERFTNAATQSARRAAALVHRLLAFARRQSLDVKPVALAPLVASMEDLLRRTLGEQIALEVVLAPDAWVARSDENQLESAILNLAINARDAMPDGGTLRIETGNATFDEAYVNAQEGLAAGDYAMVAVSDTGTGMAPDVLAKAFDPFFTTKPLGQGTGLGLSMIYGFVRQSGGHVRIHSQPGAGTSVRLYLPRDAGADAAMPEAPQAAAVPHGTGETVLVVEDDAVVRQLVLNVLRDLGYATLEAGDGLAALPILASPVTIDLLLTDVGLPGMNGRQVAEVARTHRAALPVLFMTGYAEHATLRSEFLGTGMQMIAKPFTIDTLAVKVRETLAVGPTGAAPSVPPSQLL